MKLSVLYVLQLTPLINAEGVEGLAASVAPHAVLVHALAHVPLGDVVVVLLVCLGDLELTEDERHFFSGSPPPSCPGQSGNIRRLL